MNAIQLHLMRLHACKKGLKWAGQHDDIIKAWKACKRGDWLLWLAVKLRVEQRLIVFAACECAKLALEFTDDDRPRTAIILAEQYVSGSHAVTIEEVALAAEDCEEAVLDAGCYADFAACNAAYAAMHATCAITHGGSAKELSAAAAAEATVEAGADAALSPHDADVVRNVLRLRCAKVVRKRISDKIIMAAWRSYVSQNGG
jgi:hypothetical protein